MEAAHSRRGRVGREGRGGRVISPDSGRAGGEGRLSPISLSLYIYIVTYLPYPTSIGVQFRGGLPYPGGH
jgi:hypothetical protein